MIKGLLDGTIDCISSGHVPHDEESKNQEFDHADPGIINLQTFAANLVALSKHIEWPTLLEKVTVGPRKVLGTPMAVIDVDARANLTLLDPTHSWTFDEKSNYSKSKNSPWIGKNITGKVLATFNNTKHWLDNTL